MNAQRPFLNKLSPSTVLILAFVIVTLTPLAAASADFKSQHLSIRLSHAAPMFEAFSVDSLGRGNLAQNPVLVQTNLSPIPGMQLESKGGTVFLYTQNGRPVWTITCDEKTLTLRSTSVADATVPPMVLLFNQRANHATLLGRMQSGDRRMNLPCLLHMPDMGTMRITTETPGSKLGYDARRWKVPQPFVRIEFPSATLAQPKIEYRLEITSIYPRWPGVEKNPLFDGLRRDYLNVFQLNPRTQMLANNAASDPVAFTVNTYAEMAMHLPPLADGLTALDLVRMTLDQYLAGTKGYGQVGYACSPTDADLIPWKTPWTTLDTYPSLLISACLYTEGARDTAWARSNYPKLRAWAGLMLEQDSDGDGLIEYPGTGNYGDRPVADKRPSNWWDTINFGHEDAYANALIYHACRQFADLAGKLDHPEDEKFFLAHAAKMRASYLPNFLNPATGVLAGWKSADGQLHDYWFTFVQGVAITYGLLDDQPANAIMDRMLKKMTEVGYTNFSIGLPGNLVPIRKGDYAYHDTPPHVHGVPRLEDGSDGFPFYENGGATGCWAYFTIKALYKLGRVADARRIFLPMLAGYAAGNFQGFCADGLSKDWRDWQGGCHGYEGLLVDNYLTLMAAQDEIISRQSSP